jgi:hypothetical protein
MVGNKDLIIPGDSFATVIGINYGWEPVSETTKLGARQGTGLSTAHQQYERTATVISNCASTSQQASSSKVEVD